MFPKPRSNKEANYSGVAGGVNQHVGSVVITAPPLNHFHWFIGHDIVIRNLLHLFPGHILVSQSETSKLPWHPQIYINFDSLLTLQHSLLTVQHNVQRPVTLHTIFIWQISQKSRLNCTLKLIEEFLCLFSLGQCAPVVPFWHQNWSEWMTRQSSPFMFSLKSVLLRDSMRSN